MYSWLKKPLFLKKSFLSKSFKNILLPILFQINSPPPTSMLCGMECCLGVYRMKRKEQVLTRIYTKTKQLIVSKKILKMVNFGARNISDFYFHFRSLLPQDLIKLDQKTCPMLSITKIVIKIFLLYSCLKTSLFLKKKNFFSRQSVINFLRPIALPTISMLCGELTAFGWTVSVICLR